MTCLPNIVLRPPSPRPYPGGRGRRWPSLLLIVLAALVAGSQALAAPAPSVEVQVQTTSAQTLTETATVYGQLVPNPSVLRWVSAALAGRVDTVFVTAGSTVKAGQKLARIKPTPQTLATFQSAKSSLASARAKLKQTRTLAQNGLATRSNLAAAKSAVQTAKARLAALKAEGVSAKGEILTAAHAGVVTKLPVTSGQWVNAGARIMAISPAGALWVRLGLSPEQAADVRPGAAVRLVPVFGAGRSVSGQVVRVAGQTNPKTGLIDAVVPVPPAASALYAGEWVNGTIALGQVTLPALPRSAVLHDNQGYYVFVVRGGKAYRVNVKPRVRDHGLIGVSGLKAGATVVTKGNFELTDGAAIRIAKTTPAPAAAS